LNSAEGTTANRPAETVTPQPPVQPQPGADTETKSDNSTYFEPPKLFNPNDRTAKRTSIAPVRTAVFEQPVSYRSTSTAKRGPVTDAQAKIDAAGWSSASN
jgi:hypothetical protein